MSTPPQERVRRQRDEANRRQREAQQREERWLHQLARPARLRHGDTFISLSVDKGKQSRMNDFLDGRVRWPWGSGLVGEGAARVGQWVTTRDGWV